MQYPACMTQRLIEAAEFYVDRMGDFNPKSTSLVVSILVRSTLVSVDFLQSNKLLMLPSYIAAGLLRGFSMLHLPAEDVIVLEEAVGVQDLLEGVGISRGRAKFIHICTISFLPIFYVFQAVKRFVQ